MKYRAPTLIRAFALALLASAGALPASAQSLTDNIMGSLGLLPPDPPEINYRERAPLVVPPSMDMLPQPRDASATTSDPAWPKDPDEMRRKQAALEDTRPASFNDKKATRALKPGELMGRPSSASKEPAERAKGLNNASRPGWLSPAEMGFTGWSGLFGGGSGEKPLVFEGEPERETLVQPPPGYQTPAPDAPYGVVSEKKSEWQLRNWFDRTQAGNTRH